MNCRAAALFLASCFAVSASPLFVTLAQQNTETVVLELGKPFVRELAGGQSHKYTLSLAANQYVRVLARQNGVDIVLTFRDSAGRKLVDAHDHFGGVTGVETFALITTEAGDCTIEV